MTRPESQSALAASRSTPLVFLMLWFIALMGSGMFRWSCAGGDFWLDEIVTATAVAKFHTAGEVLEFDSETNHHLSSWAIYWLSPHAHWTTYRIPAVIAGIGSVVLAGLICRRRGLREMMFALPLMGLSYLMVHYSSEARGYAYAIFFALASYALCDSALRGGRAVTCLTFAAAAILGFLSQLTFVPCYAALVVWSAWRLARDSRSWTRRLRIALLCHGPPIAFFAWFYFAHVRHMGNVGGPIIPIGDVLVEWLSLTVGGPPDGPWAIACAGIAVAILVAGLWLYAQRGSDAWVFFLGVIVVFPALTLIVLGRQEVYVRYFLIGSAFFYLLASDVLAEIFRRGRFGPLIAYALTFAFVVGNWFPTVRLMHTGRGQYVQALRLIQEQSQQQPITVGSDHDGRNRRVLDFYVTRLPGAAPILYFPTGQWPAEGPEWVIRHSLDREGTYELVIGDRTNNRYRFVREFPFAGLSGWSWGVYHNERFAGPTP
jgi:hypothetical protein